MADGGRNGAERRDKREIAQALGVSERAAEMRAQREGWAYTEQPVRGGRRRLYALGDLPADVQAALLVRAQPAPAAAPPAGAALSEGLWQRYNNASTELRAEAARRLKAIQAVDTLHAGGMALLAAREAVSAQLAQQDGDAVSPRSLARWAREAARWKAEDRLAALLPAYVGRTVQAECATQVWDWYKGHYLTRARPSHRDTYRRVKQMADAQGWDIPSAATMRRRLDAEVSAATQAVLRDGPEAARRLLPTMQRDVLSIAVGAAVNGDGLKFDRLWVKFEDGEILNTATAWVWQDVHSRRLLAHRVAKTENTDLFRLATYDLTAVCAPQDVWIDNTRVAANKLMTAGAKGRHRFRDDPEDGVGLLLMLGMEPHFTNPSKDTGNPGAKPIERAFGLGGVHEMVATNPKILAAGGYSKDTAIPVQLLREVLAEEIRRFNAQPQRRTQACRGVLSFDQAWEAGAQRQPPRVLSPTQRQLLLMCREVVKAASTNGELRIEAGRGPWARNAYWCEHLTNYRGQKLVAMYDPENLSAGVHVYGLDGRYLFAADHIPRGAFNDTEAGREHSKLRRRESKRNKAAAADAARMDALERAALYEAARPTPEDAAPPPDTNVVQAVFRPVPNPERDASRKTGTHDIATDSSDDRLLGGFLERMQKQKLAEAGWTPPTDD